MFWHHSPRNSENVCLAHWRGEAFGEFFIILVRRLLDHTNTAMAVDGVGASCGRESCVQLVEKIMRERNRKGRGEILWENLNSGGSIGGSKLTSNGIVLIEFEIALREKKII